MLSYILLEYHGNMVFLGDHMSCDDLLLQQAQVPHGQAWQYPHMSVQKIQLTLFTNMYKTHYFIFVMNLWLVQTYK